MDMVAAGLDPLDAERAGVVIDALGGTTAVGRMTFTRPTTVQSWRRVGMSASRFDHVRLAALTRGKGAELAEALAALGMVAIVRGDDGEASTADDHAADNDPISLHATGVESGTIGRTSGKSGGFTGAVTE